MTLTYDPHSSTLYDATTGAAVAVLYDDLPAAERHALGRLFAAAEGMREALDDMLGNWRYIRDLHGVGWNRAQAAAEAALRATEPPA